jgi:DNA-binding Lrp family transcriptional regulator
MRQTSIEAYFSLDKPKINQRQKQVLEALEEIAPANDRQISEHSHLPINVVTPRRGELLKKGLIKEAYINVDVTGRRATYWSPKDMQESFERDC